MNIYSREFALFRTSVLSFVCQQLKYIFVKGEGLILKWYSYFRKIFYGAHLYR